MTFLKELSHVAGRAFRLSGPLAEDATARILNVLLWTLASWFGIWGLILLPFHWKDHFWSMQNQVLTDAALICALALLHHGRFRAASATYLGGIWFFATHVMALNGGIHSPAQALYVTLPISAAWLLGYEAAFWVGAASMTGAFVFAALELAGVHMQRHIPGTPLGAWAVLVMACLIGAVPVAQILRSLKLALTRSREAEDEARRMMERLKSEVEDHRRTEHALRQSEERFRITANTAPVMILVRDANQNVVFLNNVWSGFTGRRLEQELGMGWAESVHPDDLGAYLTALSAAYTEHEEYHLQFRLRRADGEYRLVMCHGIPCFDSGHTFDGYIAACVDITDLQRSQEEALSRQKLESLGVLAAGIAHDFNNLLGSISAQSELLLEELEVAQTRESVLHIQAITARAAEIVRQLMVYAGQESATLERVDLAALAREMIPLMRVSASKDTAIEVNLPRGLPLIQANAAQLRQVLLNLFTNAAEAIGGRGVIMVSLVEVRMKEASSDRLRQQLAGEYLRLEVADTGCGMTDQIRATIFDPFFTTKGPGRGLGLAAVQGIVRSHGGSISVVSSPGNGSRFQILLPCATQTEQVPSHAESPRRLSDAVTMAKTILIVEDEETLRRAVVKLLHAKGLRVLEAGDGSAAVEVFQSHASEIDVAVVDVTLPGLPAREVLRNIREIRPQLTVIITSAYGRDQASATVNAAPLQPYIRKPYRINELLDLIRRTCRDEASVPALR